MDAGRELPDASAMVRRLRRLARALRDYARYRDLPAAFEVAEAVHRILVGFSP